MRKLLLLCGAILCFSLSASAQDVTGTLDSSGSATDQDAPTLTPIGRPPLQVGAGFQYQDYHNVYGIAFHNFGFNSDVTRYLDNWFGLEAAAAVGFGHSGTSTHIPRSLDAKSLFIGGGPHLALYNRSRFEPWIHALVGLEHFRFTQSNNNVGLGSNSALGFMAGGGLDYKLAPGAYWRIQGDFLGSHMGLATQTNYSFGSGLIINF